MILASNSYCYLKKPKSIQNLFPFLNYGRFRWQNKGNFAAFGVQSETQLSELLCMNFFVGSENIIFLGCHDKFHPS
jgi:hypothetical protein